MVEVAAWLGGILFAISAIPQAYHSWKLGESKSLSWTFLATWLLGELLMIYYALATWQPPLLFNYVFNLASLLVIIYYKVRPRGHLRSEDM